MIGKAQAEKFFNEIKENLTNEVYLEVGKKLEEQTKGNQEMLNEKICERIEKFDEETKKYVQKTIKDLKLIANTRIKREMDMKFAYVQRHAEKMISDIVKKELDKREGRKAVNLDL